MRKIDCPSYEGCDASICPMDDQSVANSIWFSDEFICKGRKCSQIPWIRKQRKIARLKPNTNGFFTVQMLNSIERISKGLKEADPDKTNAEARWFRHRNY